MKVLVLSSSCGGGHNSAGKAVSEAFLLKGHESQFLDVLEFRSKAFSKLICGSYISMVKNVPRLFGLVYRQNDNRYKLHSPFRSSSYLTTLLYCDNLCRYIKENHFDAVVCSHFFGAHALCHLRKHKKLNIPSFFVTTDYACSPLLEETDLDGIFVPHEDCIETFTKRGLARDRLYVCGIPVAQKFCNKTGKAQAREKLGFGKEKILLMMGGSMGFGNTVPLIRKILAATDENTRIILITGSNKKALEKNQKAFAQDSRFVGIGFTDQVQLYMEACDLILTKPGGLSSTEALVMNIPIVHTNPIPGCESDNADFFRSHGMSLVASSTDEIVEASLKLLGDENARNEMLENQRKNSFENTSMLIVDYILDYMKNHQ